MKFSVIFKITTIFFIKYSFTTVKSQKESCYHAAESPYRHDKDNDGDKKLIFFFIIFSICH